MIAIDGSDHDHGDGEVCPGCQFKAALATFLVESRAEGHEEWHWATGDLRQHMHAALLALDMIEAAAFGETDGNGTNGINAALAIYMVSAKIQHLWNTVTGQPGDDPGDGL